MCIEQITEIRNWLLLLLGTIGAYLTIKTFSDNTRQRRLDNTFKILEYLRKHITQAQIETFIELFHANNPLGAPENEFHLKDGRKDFIETMFSEGGCGNGDIHNMIEVFNLLAKSLNQKNLDEDLIWYEYGQIMLTCYRWTKYLEDNRDKQVDLSRKQGMTDKEFREYQKMWREQLEGINKFFFDFNLYMTRATKELLGKPTKYYTYVE
jgi:hypothetical protein